MRRQKRGMSLRQKLLCSYLGVFLIAAFTMVWYTISYANQSIYDNNIRSIQGMADKACSNFERKIEQFEQSISMCAYNKELQQIYKNNNSTIYQLYRSLKDTFLPFYQTIYNTCVEDIDTLCLYSTTGLYKWSNYLDNAENVEEESWFQQAVEEPGMHWHAGQDSLFVAYRVDPYYDLRNLDEPMGVLYMAVDIDNLFRQYVYLNWPSYRLMLRDGDGNVLMTREYGELAESEKMFCLRVASQGTGWTLEFSIPVRTLNGNGTLMLPMQLLMMVGGLGALIVLVTLYMRSLMNGLERLKQAMICVNRGELDVSIRSESEDEIGAVINTFNHMLETIRKLLKQSREDERRISGMEMEVLRAQIDPHFLYNTLSFINWKCMRAGQDEVSAIISHLAMFYRTCLNKGNNLTHVRTELANIMAYVNIQLRLHDDSFTVKYDVPQEWMEYRMLSFVMQPLVENAIRHGVDKLRSGWGEILISLREENGKLYFRVLDNGPGLPNEEGRQDTPHKGYGICNVRERITMWYGPEYGVRVENRPEGGCSASLILPVLLPETDEESKKCENKSLKFD